MDPSLHLISPDALVDTCESFEGWPGWTITNHCVPYCDLPKPGSRHLWIYEHFLERVELDSAVPVPGPRQWIVRLFYSRKEPVAPPAYLGDLRMMYGLEPVRQVAPSLCGCCNKRPGVDRGAWDFSCDECHETYEDRARQRKSYPPYTLKPRRRWWRWLLVAEMTILVTEICVWWVLR
jgi:hypothetical protein